MLTGERVLAIDFGLKRIGIAISDATRQIAFPLKTVLAGKTAKETVAILLKELESLEKERGCHINPIVLGMPFHLSGQESTLSPAVRALGKALQEATGKEIVFWDERMTSNRANSLLKETGKNRKERSAIVDPVSASLLLENYLTSQLNH